MSLPGRFMPHTVDVEPLLGSGAYGDQYGPSTPVACLIDDRRRLVRDASGAEVVSETTLIAPLDVNIPTGSRVNVGGRSTHVISTAARDGGGLPTPDHLEVTLA